MTGKNIGLFVCVLIVYACVFTLIMDTGSTRDLSPLAAVAATVITVFLYSRHFPDKGKPPQ